MQTLNLVYEALSTLLNQSHFISNALVFGSYASGKNSNLSDIDIAIETTREIDILEMGNLISILQSELNIKIDLVILNNLYKNSPLLAYNVYQNHQIIFIKDREKYQNFKLNALHNYLDFKPIIDSQNSAFSKRIQDGTLAKIKTA